MLTFLSGKVRGVVFDLDNTLIKSRQGSLHALRLVSEIFARHLEKNGFSYSKAELLGRLREIELNRRAPGSGLFPRALYNRDEWWMTLLRQLQLTGLRGSWIHQTTLRYWKAYERGSPPFKDAEPTLKKLNNSGIKLAIVSDSDGTPGVKRTRIRNLPFQRFFEAVVVAGEDTPVVKPSKAPFLLVAKRLGLLPGQCAYVGDNPSTDIEGAKKSGMLTILVKRRKYMVLGGLRAGRPDHHVTSLRNVLDLLRS